MNIQGIKEILFLIIFFVFLTIYLDIYRERRVLNYICNHFICFFIALPLSWLIFRIF